jgi:predicted nucleotidyltransferase
MSDPSVDIITRLTDTLVSTILDELGRENVRSIFLGGSVAGGEASYCVTKEGLEVFSDVDLYVVVGDGVESETARRRAREAAARVTLVGDGYRFYRAPDVGVYTIEDLSCQPARPGTVGLDTNHRMLHGDPDVPVIAAGKIGADIVAGEALYLIENRLNELSAVETSRRLAGPDENARGDRYYAFVLCKTGLDVGTASLIARGEYSPRRAERLERLTALSTDADSEWHGDRFDVLRRCGDALERMPSPDWTEPVPKDETADAVVALALAEWERIAAALFPDKGEDWCELVLQRCRAGDYAGNFRQFRAMNARCGFKRRRALVAGIHLSRYSPIDALRLSGLMEYLQSHATLGPGVNRLVQTLGPFLDRLTGACGFTQGSLAERSSDMYRVVQ